MTVLASPISSFTNPIRFRNVAIDGVAAGTIPEAWVQAGGISWTAVNCSPSHLNIPESCETPNLDAYCPPELFPCNSAFPFEIYTSHRNQTGAETLATTQARAIANLEEDTDEALAKALVRGSTGIDCDGSLAGATDISGANTTYSPATGLGALIRQRSIAGAGGTWFTIPESLLPQMFESRLVDVGSDGRLIAMGMYPVVPGATRNGPGGTAPAAGASWIFAHGPVEYALTDIRTQPFMDQNNSREVKAHRLGLVRVDSCDRFAIQIAHEGPCQ